MGARRTRRELLGAGAAGGVLGAALIRPAGTALLMPAAAQADASSRPGPEPVSPAAILGRLVSIELLLSYCYQHVLGSPVLDSIQRGALAQLQTHEQAHVQALERHLAARGGVAPRPPAGVAVADLDLARRNVGGRLGQLRGPRDALWLLLSVERVSIGAFFVALTKLEDPQLIRLASEIMASDAQHEVILGEQLNPGDAAAAAPYGLVQGVQ